MTVLRPVAEGQLVWNGMEGTPIALDQAIRMALANNLDVRIAAITPQVNHDRVMGAWGAFDPVFSSSLTSETIDRPQNTQELISTGGAGPTPGQVLLSQQLDDLLGILRGDIRAADVPRRTAEDVPEVPNSGEPRIFEEDNVRAQTSLEGRIPIGTRYRFFLSSARFENTLTRTSDSSLFSPEYFTTTGITLTQPLLRDFGTAANLVEVRVARKNEQIALLNWEQQLMNSIGIVMLTYYDMVFAAENVKVKQDAIALADTLRTENQRRLDLGLMSPIDVQQAEVSIARGRDELLVAKNLFIERQNALRRQILGDFNPDAPRVFVPSTKPEAEVPKLDRSALLQEAYAHRPDYLETIEQASREDIRVRFTRNQLWPRLDLQGTYALNGLAGNYGDSISRAFDRQGPQWNAGFVFSFPLGNVQARAQHRIAVKQKEQAILDIKRAELSVGVDVDTVLHRVQTNAQRIGMSFLARKLAEEVVRIQQRRLGEGVGTSFEVLERQNELSQARTRELSAITDLNKSLAQLQIATGTILRKQGIVLENPKR